MKSKMRWFTVAAAMATGMLLAELALRTFGPTYDSGLARQRIERMLAQLADSANDPEREQRRATGERELNPYYGFDERDGFRLMERFIALEALPDRRNLFVVYVCGGSVPEIFVGTQLGAADQLAALLEADPKLAGRQVRFCRLARAGYKQPQQLTKLVYLLTQGGRPDAVVHIDGLNEVRLGTNNLQFGVHPSWPSARHWLHLVAGPASSPEAKDAYFLALASKDKLIRQAQAALASKVFGSAILGLWTERKLAHGFADWSVRQDAYAALLADESQPGARAEEGSEQALAMCVRTWAEASRLMHAICQERGIAYLHLIQPTLHDEGSKKISADEWRNCVGKEGLMPFIKNAYDQLRIAGKQLAAEGVPWVDSTYLFAAIEETLYYDRAHFGKTGNRLLAQFIAGELLKRL